MLKTKQSKETDEELLIRVSGEVASKYFIQGYTHEDLCQESFILGMEVIKKYQEGKGRLENFLRVALNNAVQNLVKSKTVEKKPCGCPDGTYCSHSVYRESKARVLSTRQYPEDVEFSARDVSIRDSFTDLLPLIDQKLPLSMRQDWRKILEDTHVVKSRKAEIFEEIREIVREFETSSVKENISPWEYSWENGGFFIENDLHLVRLDMDEEAANIWLHTLSGPARQVYIKLRECGTASYDEISVLAESINSINAWDV